MAPQNLFSNLNTSSSSPPSPKAHLTTGLLPSHIDLQTHPSSTKPPFRQLNTTSYIARTTLLLPPSLATTLKSFSTLQSPPLHAKCFLTLSSLIEPNSPLLKLVQTPGTLNLNLLSEGTPGVDDTFCLLAGKLTINISRERYEKMGIPNGVAVKSGARKHGKQGERREVSVDLRSVTPKMLERWRRGASEVWTERVGCVVGVEGRSGEEARRCREVLEGEGVDWCGDGVEERVERRVRVPGGLLVGGCTAEGMRVEEDEELVWELVEWADLVALGSPRVKEGDRVDEFVTRYEVPEKDAAETVTQDVAVLSWKGMLSPRWVTELLLQLIKASRTQKSEERPWAVLSVATHHTNAVGNVDGCTIFLRPWDADAALGGLRQPEAKDDKDTERAEGDGTVAEEDDTMEVETGFESTAKSETAGASSSQSQRGLQRFTCLQFVDSRVHS